MLTHCHKPTPTQQSISCYFHVYFHCLILRLTGQLNNTDANYTTASPNDTTTPSQRDTTEQVRIYGQFDNRLFAKEDMFGL